MVQPIENAKTVSQARNYGTSILAEGIRGMYTGELVLFGNPSIKPHDVIYIYDDYTRMYGPIEVKAVTHVMSAESGFISIVEPHAYVDVLSQGMGPASIIKEIFDIAMLALIIFPPAGLIGAEAKVAAQGAKLVGREALESAVANAFVKGKAWGNQVVQFMSNKYTGVAQAFEATSRAALEKDTLSYLARTIYHKETLTTVEKSLMNNKVLTEINNARSLRDATIPQVTKISQASHGEVAEALKRALNVKGGTAQEAQIDFMVAKSGVKTAVSEGSAAITKGAKNAVVSKETWAAITGISFMNMVKTLAIGAPIVYYQMFAGMDDTSYACPLRITPLSLEGQPFHAGLDGITHRSGIWEHMAGEWRRFRGSLDTVSSALEEFYTNVTGSSL
jgi:hypothetical protein